MGAGLTLDPHHIGWSVLAGKLAGPLLLSPVIALVLAWVLTPLIRYLALTPGEADCVCVDGCMPTLSSVPNPEGASALASELAVTVGAFPECRSEGGIVLVPPRAVLLRSLHILSAGAVSFARGLNDTPKIATVLLPLAFLSKPGAITAVAIAMGIGGWFLAKGVTTTMSHRITHLEGREPDALAGSLTTAFLVLLASRWGLPVSTTHVATGALVGAGASRGEWQFRILARILLAWVTTLPLAAGFAVLAVWLLKTLR